MNRILIAEDDNDIRELIAITLQFHGFSVATAEDGEVAVALATEDDFDLILMDVRMPRMTGYEACRFLKTLESTRHIPIIFLSAKGQESEIQTGLDAGAEHYILKPFAPEVLIGTINRILSKAAEQQAE